MVSEAKQPKGQDLYPLRKEIASLQAKIMSSIEANRQLEANLEQACSPPIAWRWSNQKFSVNEMIGDCDKVCDRRMRGPRHSCPALTATPSRPSRHLHRTPSHR